MVAIRRNQLSPTRRQFPLPITFIRDDFAQSPWFLRSWLNLGQPRPSAAPETPGCPERQPIRPRPNGRRYLGELWGNVRLGASALLSSIVPNMSTSTSHRLTVTKAFTARNADDPESALEFIPGLEIWAAVDELGKNVKFRLEINRHFIIERATLDACTKPFQSK